MRRTWWMVLALCATVGCKAYEAPPQVQAAAKHQLEDLVLIEKELLSFVPDDATIAFTTITGESKTTQARQLWKERLRAFMFRGAGLLEWSRGKPFDEEAAFAKLFPDKVGGGDGE